MLLGKAVMINWTDVAPEHRAQYDAWHCHEHMVGRVAIPGFQRGRRYQAVHARRDFLTMYEVDDLNVLTGKEYLAKANAPSELTLRTTPLVKNSIRGLVNVRASFGIGTGGHMLTLRFGPHDGAEAALEKYLAHEALPAIAKRVDIAGAHWLVADKTASSMTPVERQGRPTTIPNWIVLIEGFTQNAVESAEEDYLSDAKLDELGCAVNAERDLYQLQILVPKTKEK